MLDVHVLIKQDSHAEEQARTTASIAAAIEAAGYPVAVHYVEATGTPGAARKLGYEEGEFPYVLAVALGDEVNPQFFEKLKPLLDQSPTYVTTGHTEQHRRGLKVAHPHSMRFGTVYSREFISALPYDQFYHMGDLFLRGCGAGMHLVGPNYVHHVERVKLFDLPVNAKRERAEFQAAQQLPVQYRRGATAEALTRQLTAILVNVDKG